MSWLANFKGIDWKKFWTALIAVFILANILEWVMHGWLLTNASDGGLLSFLRKPAVQSFTLWMWMGYLIFSWAFVWIYANGWENKPWSGQDFRYGFMIWLLWSVPVAFMYYTGENIDWSVFFKKVLLELGVILLLAYTAAWLYKPSVRTKTA